MTKPKGRSNLQKSQAMSNLAKMNETKQGHSDSGPSNTLMSTDPETVRQAELEAPQEHAELYERRFRM